MRLSIAKSLTTGLLFLVQLTVALSCAPVKIAEYHHYSTRRDLVSLAGHIEAIESARGLGENIIGQIKTEQPYFVKENYVWFSANADSAFYAQLPMFSRVILLDIYVDFRLLNNFIFVFTEQSTDSVVGYIRQNRHIEQSEKHYYYILDREIKNILGDGLYDIYGFHNDTLVLKNTYPSRTQP